MIIRGRVMFRFGADRGKKVILLQWNFNRLSARPDLWPHILNTMPSSRVTVYLSAWPLVQNLDLILTLPNNQLSFSQKRLWRSWFSRICFFWLRRNLDIRDHVYLYNYDWNGSEQLSMELASRIGLWLSSVIRLYVIVIRNVCGAAPWQTLKRPRRNQSFWVHWRFRIFCAVCPEFKILQYFFRDICVGRKLIGDYCVKSVGVWLPEEIACRRLKIYSK